MKRIVMALLLFSATLSAQEAEKKKSATEEMMAMYVEAAKPVGEHERLAELTGPWNVTTRLWFDPAGEPQTAAGSGTGRLILGGRFAVVDTDIKGALASETMTVFGFDRRTSDYTMVGIDTLGTYAITAAGKYDAAKKGVVLNGSYAMPPTGAEQKYHFEWTRPRDEEHLLTLYFLMGGSNVRIAETRFVRP